MGFFGRGVEADADRGIYLYVRIKRTKEVVKLRIDPYNDLAQQFESADGSDSPNFYICRKEIMGRKGFDRAVLNLEFDGSRKLIASEIEGGELVNEDEYDQSGYE